MDADGRLVPHNAEYIFSKLLLPMAGCLGAVAAGWYIAVQPNVVSAVMRMVGVVGFLIAVVSPRFGLYVLILMAAYLDYTKRFVILPSGSASMQDVTNVLSAAPLTFVGVCLGILVGKILKRVTFTSKEWMLIWAIVVVEFAMAVTGYRDAKIGGSNTSVANLVNASVYIPLILVMGIVFRDSEDLVRFFQFALLVFVPVAAYGLWQAKFGFTKLEYLYLASGLTQTGGNLEEARPRPFSTLSSPHAFAVTMAILFICSLPLMMKSVRPRNDPCGLFLRFVLPPLYFAASILSFVRAGWAVWIFGVIGLVLFRNRFSTFFFYGSFATLFALLVFNADLVLDKLGEVQAMLPSGTAFSDSAFSLGTYSDRLFGYRNLITNPEMWTWFGNSRLAYGNALDRDEVSHDAVGQALVSFGVVGLGVIAAIAISSLFWLHKRVLRLRERRDRILGCSLLSIVVGIMGSGMLTGNHLAVYPLSLLFWMMLGSLLLMIRLNEESAIETPAPEPVVHALPLYSSIRSSSAGKGAPLFS